MSRLDYELFIRNRITELRLAKGVSERRLSLDLGKNEAYLGNITCGKSLPSMHEFFNILKYLDITPAAFFAPCEDHTSHYARLCERLRSADEETLNRIDTLLGWME